MKQSKPLYISPLPHKVLTALANPRYNVNSLLFAFVTSGLLYAINQDQGKIPLWLTSIISLCIAAVLVSAFLRRDPADQFSKRYVQFSLYQDHLVLSPGDYKVAYTDIKYIEHLSLRRSGSVVEFNSVLIATHSSGYSFQWSLHPGFGRKMPVYGWDLDQIIKKLGFDRIGQGKVGQKFVYRNK